MAHPGTDDPSSEPDSLTGLAVRYFRGERVLPDLVAAIDAAAARRVDALRRRYEPFPGAKRR